MTSCKFCKSLIEVAAVWLIIGLLGFGISFFFYQKILKEMDFIQSEMFKLRLASVGVNNAASVENNEHQAELVETRSGPSNNTKQPNFRSWLKNRWSNKNLIHMLPEGDDDSKYAQRLIDEYKMLGKFSHFWLLICVINGLDIIITCDMICYGGLSIFFERCKK